MPKVWVSEYSSFLIVAGTLVVAGIPGFSREFRNFSKLFWLGGAAPQPPQILAGGALPPQTPPPLTGLAGGLPPPGPPAFFFPPF